MVIAGLFLVAGMELRLAPGDYVGGESQVSFIVDGIAEVHQEWVVLAGRQRPSTHAGWQQRQVCVRISALKRCLTLPCT